MLRIDSMEKKKFTEEELLEIIKNRFGAEPETPELDEELKRFIDERIKLEQGDASWSLDSFLQLYEKLKKYGLEEKLMRNLEFFIRLELELRKDEFLKSKFYKHFKDHKIVERVVNE